MKFSSVISWAATIDRTWALIWARTWLMTCFSVSGSMKGSWSKKWLMSGLTNSLLRRVGAFLMLLSRMVSICFLARFTSSSFRPKRFIRSSSV